MLYKHVNFTEGIGVQKQINTFTCSKLALFMLLFNTVFTTTKASQFLDLLYALHILLKNKKNPTFHRLPWQLLVGTIHVDSLLRLCETWLVATQQPIKMNFNFSYHQCIAALEGCLLEQIIILFGQTKQSFVHRLLVCCKVKTWVNAKDIIQTRKKNTK